MQLNSLVWGEGDQVALLIHGMLGAATQFWELGPALAARGYRSVAVDLPGHGDSPPVADASIDLFVEALLDTIGCTPALAIGQSMGAVVLHAAVPSLRPSRAVYVDTPLEHATPEGQPSAEVLRQRMRTSRLERTESRLRATHPAWSAEDCRIEAEAAMKFDVETAVALELAYAADAGSAPVRAPVVPSLVIRAEPSRFVSPRRARELVEMGFCVRAVPGAGHCVWYGHLGEFVGVLDEWLQAV
jgi:pimeloyl-ACP methyl ester carboxylesterase